MISVYRVGRKARVNGGVRYVQLELRGLSTDSKPVTTADLPSSVNAVGNAIENGSVFIEIDTQKILFYDLVSQEWKEV